MECSAIFEDYISNCNTKLQIYASFDPNTLYKWVLTAPNGLEFSGEKLSGVYGGYLEISVDDLPDGLLNQYAGTFYLQFFDTPYQCRIVSFTIGKAYDTIAFTVKAGNNIKPNLGCA